MESCVKYQYLRFVGHYCETSLDTHDVCACVERSKVAAELKLSENFVSEKNGLKEVRTAVDYSVTDSFYLVHIGDNACFGVCEVLYDYLCSDSVVGHGIFSLDFFAVFAFSVLNATVDTDSFADTFSENGFCSGIKELILE